MPGPWTTVSHVVTVASTVAMLGGAATASLAQAASTTPPPTQDEQLRLQLGRADEEDARRRDGDIQRMYGARPRFNYYIGTSQGGREALAVAQRYPADYHGVSANVPILGFSTLMLAPDWACCSTGLKTTGHPERPSKSLRVRRVFRCARIQRIRATGRVRRRRPAPTSAQRLSPLADNAVKQT